MLPTLLAAQLIYQLLVCTSVYGKVRPFHCPENCRCDEITSTVRSCALSSILEYNKIVTNMPVEKLSVANCNERDFGALQPDSEGYKPILQLDCKKMTLLDSTQYPNCKYSAISMPKEQCLYICRDVNNGVFPVLPGKRTCFCCDRPSIRVRRSPSSNAGSVNLTQNRAEENSTDTKERPLTSVVVVGGLSVLAFLINFIVMVKLCCSPLTVIDLFATALFLFNLILSLYGLSMAFYLFRPSLQKYTWYCQFFTSIKLFSLGSALYTMVFLIFHRPIRRSSGDGNDMEEGKKKAAHRDAIFKGIVFLLEAVMLAGVLGVLSWIKTSNWKKLCVIITPTGSVEGLLHGIEVWYIVLSGLLVSWYFGNYVYRQYKKFKEYRERMKQREEEDDDMGSGVCDEPDTPEIAPYIIRDFPLFVLVAISFSIWLAGFIISTPGSNYLTFENAPVARICSLIVPIILQPLIYAIRETWVFKCFCFRNGKHRTNTVEEIKLNKSPSDESQGSQEASNNNLELTQFDNAGTTQPPIAKVEQTDQSDDDDATENDPLTRKNKTRLNDFEVPKVVCRSPIPSGEHTRLLDDTDGVKSEPPKIVVGGLDVPTASTDLINGEGDADMNGRVSRGPTFYPISEKEAAAGGVKQVELKGYSPIKEDRVAEETKQVDNNGKEKRKDKKKKMHSLDSTGSSEYDACSRSDSSSSREDAPSAGNTNKPDWDPRKFERKPSPTEITKLKNEINKPSNNNNNNNNDNINNNRDIDQIIPNNTNLSEATPINMGPRSEANHTGKRLKKPVLTRDSSGSVER